MLSLSLSVEIHFRCWIDTARLSVVPCESLFCHVVGIELYFGLPILHHFSSCQQGIWWHRTVEDDHGAVGLITLHTLMLRDIQNRPFFQCVTLTIIGSFSGISGDQWQWLFQLVRGREVASVSSSSVTGSSCMKASLRHWICSCAPSACVDDFPTCMVFFSMCRILNPTLEVHCAPWNARM